MAVRPMAVRTVAVRAMVVATFETKKTTANVAQRPTMQGLLSCMGKLVPRHLRGTLVLMLVVAAVVQLRIVRLRVQRVSSGGQRLQHQLVGVVARATFTCSIGGHPIKL